LKAPKILTSDVETSPLELLIRAYDLRVNITRYSHQDIHRDWTMLSASWKLLGGKPVGIAINPDDVFNDKEVVMAYHDALSDADIWVGHNFDAFDYKKFNTRAIFHGLKPIAKKPSVDTLKVARQLFKFTSNKLAYLADFLGVAAKDQAPDWLKVMAGDPKEIRHMLKYNKIDCIAGEDVYLRMRPWMTNHPVRYPIRDVAGNAMPTCDPCGGVHFQKRGDAISKASGRYDRYQCMGCGAWPPIAKCKEITKRRA
jgi:hypothetical protein